MKRLFLTGRCLERQSPSTRSAETSQQADSPVAMTTDQKRSRNSALERQVSGSSRVRTREDTIDECPSSEQKSLLRRESVGST